MALTETQKSQLRKYLGYPERFHQTRPEFELALVALQGTATGEAQVLAELARLVIIDSRLDDAPDRLRASTVGTITLNPMEIGALRSEGKRIVRRIANIMGCEVNGSAFGGGWPSNVLNQG